MEIKIWKEKFWEKNVEKKILETKHFETKILITKIYNTTDQCENIFTVLVPLDRNRKEDMV